MINFSLFRMFQSTVLSIITITIGCLVASAGDLEFDTVAYMAGLTSVFAQAGYLTLVQRASAVEAALKNAELQVIPIRTNLKQTKILSSF